MNTYLFLLAWVQDSDSMDEDTNVYGPEDLFKEFENGNEQVFAVFVKAPNEDIANAFGLAGAFHENYTGMDSVSTCIEVSETYLKGYLSNVEDASPDVIEVNSAYHQDHHR